MVDVLNLVSDKWLELIWRVTWQGSVFIGIVFLVTKIFRRLSPTIKHLLWMLVIVKFLIMPFVTVPIALPAFPTLAHKSPVTPITETPVLPQESGIIPEPLPALSTGTLPPASSIPHPKIAVHIPSVLFSGWLCGMLILLLGITFRSIKLKKDISSAKVLEDKDILNMIVEVAKDFKIKPPLLKISNKFKSPLACGILHPILIFPEHVIQKFTQSELRAIINHESAHIKRLDILTNWFQILVQIIYFFNPLIWYTNRQIRIEREHACDDWVLQMGGEPRKTYADALLKVVELCSGRERFALGIVGVSETFTLMAGRLKMIMDSGRKISTRLSVGVIIGLVVVSVAMMPSCVGKKSSVESSVSLEHYRSAWLKHLGSPTGKPGWEKEAAEKAVAELQKAIEIEPNNVMFRQSLAFAFEKLGEPVKAEEQYIKTIELMPQDGFLHYALARLYAKDENTQDKTISELRIAIQQNPDEALFHYHLAYLLYMKAGEYQKERQYLITDEILAKEAFEQIQEGNKKAQFTQYTSPYPKDIADKLDYMRVISLWSDENFPELDCMLDLCKANLVLGKIYEKQDDTLKAEEIYMATLIMGKKYAGQESLAIIKLLVGIAIDSKAFSALEELYSKQNLQRLLQWTQWGKKMLEEINRLSKEKVAEISKYSTPFWTKEEKEIRQKKGEDFLFHEASFVREMLFMWPTIGEERKYTEINEKSKLIPPPILKTDEAKQVEKSVLKTIIASLEYNESLINSAKVRMMREDWYSGKYFPEERTAYEKSFYVLQNNKYRFDSRLGRGMEIDPNEIKMVFDGEKTVRINQAYDGSVSTVMIEPGDKVSMVVPPWKWNREHRNLPLSKWAQKQGAVMSETTLPDGNNGYLLEVIYNDIYGNKEGYIKAWIDPAKSFCAPRIEEYKLTEDKNWYLFLRYECDFKKVDDGPVFFPFGKVATDFKYNKETKDIEPSWVRKYKIEELEINKPLSEDLFGLQFPSKAWVTDTITGIGYQVP